MGVHLQGVDGKHWLVCTKSDGLSGTSSVGYTGIESASETYVVSNQNVATVFESCVPLEFLVRWRNHLSSTVLVHPPPRMYHSE